MLRLLDTEFITDLALAVDMGVISTSPSLLKGIYKSNDKDYPQRDVMNERISGTLGFIRAEMSFVAKTISQKRMYFSPSFAR
jgi:hypothetical protein